MSNAFDPYRKWLGIPPEEQPPHHYRLLGIPIFEEDEDVIENAAHRQMAYVRTFQTGKHADLSQQLLNELAAAKVCLLSRDRKAAYDEELHQQLARGTPGATVATHAGRRGLGSLGTAVATSRMRGSNSGDGQDQAESPNTLDDFSSDTPLNSTAQGHVRPLTRKQLLFVPMLFGALGVVAVTVIVALFAMNFRRQWTGTGSVDSLPVPLSADGANAAAASGSQGDPEAEAAAAHEHIHHQLALAREAMAERNLTRARTHLRSAGVPQRNESLRVEVERLETLLVYLAEFQKAVRRGIEVTRRRIRFEDQRLQYAPPPFPPEALEFVEIDQDRITYNVDGELTSVTPDELPARHAGVLAMTGLGRDDPFVRIYIAAFLLTDRTGDPDENRRLALALWQEAARKDGAPNRCLADEFQLSLTSDLEEAAPASASPPQDP